MRLYWGPVRDGGGDMASAKTFKSLAIAAATIGMVFATETAAQAKSDADKIEDCRGVTGLAIDDAIASCTSLLHGSAWLDDSAFNGGRRYDLLYLRALAYAAKQDHERAVADLDKVLRFSPDRANAYFYRARELEALGRRDDAERDRKAYAKLRHDGNRLIPDCRPIDASAIQAARRGTWIVMQPTSSSTYTMLEDYGDHREMAERVATFIQRQQFDRVCYVARPHPTLTYWLRGTDLPKPSEGECTQVDHETLAITRANEALQIVDDRRVVLATGYDALASQQALAVLRALKVSSKCAISDDKNAFVYWAAD